MSLSNICFQRHLATSVNTQCSTSYLVQLVLTFHSSCILQLVLFSKSNVPKERQDFSSIKINNDVELYAKHNIYLWHKTYTTVRFSTQSNEISGTELKVLFHLPKALASLQIYEVSFHLYRSERIWLSFFNGYCSTAYQTYAEPKPSFSMLYSNTVYKYCNHSGQGEQLRAMRRL